MCYEEFSITSNDHPRNVAGVLWRYLDEETLVDCTVAAEGGYLTAHRVVLSACSAYFELLFRHEARKEKVVVLEDLKLNDLKSLIAFMYKGQVTVSEDRLRDFVRAAEFLQIKGLPDDLVQNFLGLATEKSVVCKKVGLPSQLSHNGMTCAANSGESSHLQLVTSISRNQTGDENPSTNMLKNLSQENVPLQPLSFLDSDPNRETLVFPGEKEPLVEPKEELDVEDTPIWESEDENTRALTNLPSTTAEEGIQNELIPVPNTISCSSSFVSSPQFLENESVTSIAKLSSVTGIIPSSTSTARSTPLVPIVPTEQSGCENEGSVSSVLTELAEQIICVKNKPVVKTEVIPAVIFLHRESVVEPMHEVRVEDLRSWKREKVITGTDSAGNQETRFQDVDAAGAPENIQSAVSPNVIFKDFPASHVVAQKDKNDVNVQEVKEKIEVDEWRRVQECKSIDVIESTVDKVVESTWHSRIVVQVHDDNLFTEEREMNGQEMMVETLERALGVDAAVEQSHAEEEDSAPLSERVSKMFGKKLYRCLRCPGVFCTGSELQLHAKNVHKKKRSKCCEVCLATFALKSDLMRHMRRHTAERPLKCEVCEKTFCSSSDLTNHKHIHTGERPFQCDVCKRLFSVKRNLTSHIRTHTGARPFHCNICNSAFSLRSNLNRHMRTHTGERPFHCDVCKRSFSVKYTLISHMYTHAGECRLQCNVCKMPFSDKNNFINHMRTHTGERPFHCNVCNSVFTRRNHLNRHMRTHTGERPFHCDVCKKSFSVKYALISHMRTHSGECPFQCNVCKRAFMHKSSLTTHIRAHTDMRPFHCDVCIKTFSLKSRLNRHMRTHTG